MDEAANWGRDLARDMAAYATGRLDWADVDRGCLLVGPPGVGKTTYARALAATCGAPLIAASYSQWQASKEGHLGDLLKAMAASFEQARKSAPCILFLDELDAFYDRSGPSAHRDWWASVVGALLEQLDGVGAREGVVVIGATNHPDMVDPAIIRSGRLDRTIVIPMPDQEALAKILRVHLGSDLSEADLSLAAVHALGSTGADCEKWVRGARRRARNAGRQVTLDDLMKEIRGEGQEASADHRKIYAVHEAGHALLRALEQPGALRLASIRQSADEGGRVVAEVTRGPITQASIDVQLRQLLAGRAAEDVVLGHVTGGAGGPIDSDLAKATRLALDAETALGLSERPLVWLGMWRGNEMSSLLLDRPELAQRVERRLQAAYSSACDFIRKHRALLDVIVNQLLKQEVLTGANVEAIVKAGGRVAVAEPPQAAAGPL
jgi:ATP-dependent Zn protease